MASLANSLIKEINIPPLLNPESISDLTQQLNALEKENTRFVVLKGGDTVFCNGLDLRWVAHNQSGSYMKEMQEYGDFLKKLQTGKCIIISIVKGKASGGGMGIVCASDYVLATTGSEFSLPEGLLGLIPGMILPSLLNRLSPKIILPK
jgi:enoyl-CoA hydratase/carnithine racemase